MQRGVRALVFVFVGVVLCGGLSACDSGGSDTTAFQGFTGCAAGAGSAITFLQRSLDEAGDAEPEALSQLLPDFDSDVRAMLLRAREVHCTEEGFNAALILRTDELVAQGPGGVLLVAVVTERGLGSLVEGGGGLITLPGG